jgi:hypothetical protein
VSAYTATGTHPDLEEVLDANLQYMCREILFDPSFSGQVSVYSCVRMLLILLILPAICISASYYICLILSVYSFARMLLILLILLILPAICISAGGVYSCVRMRLILSVYSFARMLLILLILPYHLICISAGTLSSWSTISFSEKVPLSLSMCVRMLPPAHSYLSIYVSAS